jgi:hypothetical protein
MVELVEGGLDVEAAAAEASVKMAEIHGDPELVAELEQAYRTATARLRGRLLHRVLAGDDDKLLAAALDRREQAQADMAATASVGGEATARRQKMIDDLMREVEAHAVIHKANLRREIMAELKAEGRLREVEIIPPEPKPLPSPRALAVLDAGSPIPRSRLIAAREPPPEPPQSRSVGRPKALAGPGQPMVFR